MIKAQSTLEYTVVIAVFAAALIAMTTYIKRGFQGNYRQNADQIGSAYEPKNTTSDSTLVTDSFGDSISNTTEEDENTPDGVVKRLKTVTDFTNMDNSSQQGHEDVGPL